MRAKLVSIQVGIPRTVARNGQEVSTGIFKSPVVGRIPLRMHNLKGDQQADLENHGGQDKAVYAYPSEHYEFWKGKTAIADLPWGAFGENFTTEGLLEEDVCIGDRFTIGTAEVVVTQPRMPCFKLGVRLADDTIEKRFLASRRTGFYLRVLREGEVGAGDEITLAGRDENGVSISDALKIHFHEPTAKELIERALKVGYLSAAWRKKFLQSIGDSR